MKYAVILGDGMADWPLPALSGKTPIEAADIPNMRELARLGQTGLVQTVAQGFKPGSDIANLAVLGYPPAEFYSGRSPLEALSMGIDMQEDDIAIRCNLVTIEDGVMKDYSAGEISTEEAALLIQAVQEKLGGGGYTFYAGLSYRHCLIWAKGTAASLLTPPHDIMGEPVREYLPRGEGGEELRRLVLASGDILKDHPVNLARRQKGLRPASHIWLWGAGNKPRLACFKDRYGVSGAVVSAVDLLKGIAKGCQMLAPDVAGATGTLSTNFKGKTDAVIHAFQTGYDFAYLHIEAPDECGHQGDMQGKIRAIEQVDAALGRVCSYLKDCGEDYAIAVLPDHATPLVKRTHTSEPVPYILYRSKKPYGSGFSYGENEAKKGVFLADGSDIMRLLLQKNGESI